MTAAPLKARLFEDQLIPTEDNNLLHVTLMLPKPPIRPRRVVLMAPLVGAGASQPLIIFRNFTRRGAILVSFEYRGHLGSSGVFELDGTIGDVRRAVTWAWQYAHERGLPLHGFATCFGTVPLLAQFRDGGCGRLLSSFSAVSGLFRLDQILRFDGFAPVLARRLGRPVTAAALLHAVAEGVLDSRGNAFREALREYLATLFPEQRVERDRFEELHYDRVNIPRTLLQLSGVRYLEGAVVPPDIPCNFFYGRHDELLSLRTAEGREAYCNHVRSLIPHAVLWERELDHFGRGPDHDPVIETLSDIFERYDRHRVPPHHLPATAAFERLGNERSASVLE